MKNIVQNVNLAELERLNCNAWINNCTLTIDLGELVFGNMSVMTVGSFHVFTDIVTLTCVLQVKLHFQNRYLLCI